MSINPRTVLDVLREADGQSGIEDWAAAFEQGAARELGMVSCMVLTVAEGGERLTPLREGSPAARQILAAGHGGLGPSEREQLYRRGAMAVTTRELYRGRRMPDALAGAMDRAGVAEIIGLVAQPGLSVMLLADREVRLDAMRRHALLSLVRHGAASVAVRSAVMEEALLDDELPVALRGMLAVLDERRRETIRRGSRADAATALRFLDQLSEGGFAVVHEERRGRRRRLVAVRLRDPVSRDLRTLEPGERAVLEGLRRGLAPKEIAYELGIATPTISSRIRRIATKLGIDPRSDVVRAAGAAVPRGAEEPREPEDGSA